MRGGATAAVLTVGTELTAGFRHDTNGGEVAARLTAAGFRVAELASVGDDLGAAADALARLTGACDLVVVTGGLGPTHDDVTRDAAARALSRPLVRDCSIEEALAAVAARHRDPQAAAAVFRQADVVEGARVLPPTVGTAPGQVIETPRGHLVLLPGPPREMLPMLADAFEALGLSAAAHPFLAGTTGLPESDVQVIVQRALEGVSGVGFTLLARPGEVRVVLVDDGIGPDGLAEAGARACEALGERCFARSGETLAEVVLRLARVAGVTLSVAESCTGGMVAAALTDVPGSSESFLGGIVAYSNDLKVAALGVSRDTLTAHGAVSAETALEMAAGARAVTGSDWAVAVTGTAGPGGGTADKPVGTVDFALDGPSGPTAVRHLLAGDRAAVRLRATATALDLLRLAISGHPA